MNVTSSPRTLSLMLRNLSCCLLVAICLLNVTGVAHAINGRIAYSSNRTDDNADGDYEIFTMLPDGSGVDNVSDNPAQESTPAWNYDSTRIAFASTRNSGQRELYTMQANGSGQGRYSHHAGDDANPVWNPNQSRIIYTSSLSGQPDLWIVDTGGSAPSGLMNLTNRDGIDSFASVSPDATKIVFASQRVGNTGDAVGDFNIWVMTYDKNTDNTGTPVQLTATAGADTHPRWSRDGTKIYFASQRIGDTGNVGDYNIWVMDANGANPTQLTDDASQDIWPAVAPDGDKIAFQSNRAGNEDIWVMDTDGSNETNLTASSTFEEKEPAWSEARETPSLIVTIAEDIVDPFDGQTSLREALAYAATQNPSTVSFAPALNGGTLTVATIGNNSQGNSAFLISTTVIIQGPAAGVTIQRGQTAYPLRAFLVNASGNLTIRNATLANFRQTGADGTSPPSPPFAFPSPDVNGQDGLGGTFYIAGTALIEDCTIRNSSVLGGNGGAQERLNLDTMEMEYNRGSGGNGRGSAIYSTGTLTVLRTSLNNNTASGGFGGIANGTPGTAGSGFGSIYNSGNLTLTASTLSFNSAPSGAGVYNTMTSVLRNCTLVSNTATTAGGGVFNNAGSLSLINCTISSNSGGASGGVRNVTGATLAAINTIIAGNSSANMQNNGVFNDLGHNLLAGNPLLGPLADNGGLTLTCMPQPGSPAINAGDNAVTMAPYNITTDQRGSPRLTNGTVDIGAVETAAMYAISGKIVDGAGAGLAGVNVSRGGGASVLTDASGNYTLTNVPVGPYTLTPTKSGYSFTPTTRNVNVVAANLTNQNFTGYNYVVSGRVAFSNGVGIANVKMQLNNGTFVLTNGAGYYSFTGMKPGAYNLIPVLSGYSFVPAQAQITITNANIINLNFIGGYSISGRIADSQGTSLQGLSVMRSGSPTPVTTNSAGYYFFYGVTNGTYTITPTPGAYGFTPPTRQVTVSGTSQANQNFIGTTGYIIQGRIATSNGTAIEGVSVTRTGSPTPALTNSAGYYIFYGVANGSYTVTPSKSGYTFAPPNKVVVVNGADMINQGFTGTGP